MWNLINTLFSYKEATAAFSPKFQEWKFCPQRCISLEVPKNLLMTMLTYHVHLSFWISYYIEVDHVKKFLVRGRYKGLLLKLNPELKAPSIKTTLLDWFWVLLGVFSTNQIDRRWISAFRASYHLNLVWSKWTQIWVESKVDIISWIDIHYQCHFFGRKYFWLSFWAPWISSTSQCNHTLKAQIHLLPIGFFDDTW